MKNATSLSARLKTEIALNRDFQSLDEQVLLSFVFTDLRLTKLSQAFFASYEMTDAQFNVLMILYDYRDRGIHQFELAEIMVVNRASVGGIIDRLVKQGWVRREQDPTDRRSNYVHITARGSRVLVKVRAPYYRMVPPVLDGFTAAQKRTFLELLDKFRGNINDMMDASA